MLAQQFTDNNFPAVWAATELTPRSGPARVHPRINRTLRLIPGRLEGLQDVSLKALADLSGLSTSRFMHLFTEAAGVPLRRYILRLRLQRAWVELLAGTTVTTAACSAGFSDASHLTRTFRRVLGLTPTALFPRKRSSAEDETIPQNRSPEVGTPAATRRNDMGWGKAFGIGLANLTLVQYEGATQVQRGKRSVQTRTANYTAYDQSRPTSTTLGVVRRSAAACLSRPKNSIGL